MEEYTTGTGQKLLVHNKADCVLEHCVVHNPSDHPMKDFPTHWRSDRGIMGRICKHGVGHPDPDGLVFIRETKGIRQAQWEAIHGCDGCCG